MAKAGFRLPMKPLYQHIIQNLTYKARTINAVKDGNDLTFFLKKENVGYSLGNCHTGVILTTLY